MLVGIFFLTSDSTCGLVIHLGKTVMSVFAMQAQLPIVEKHIPFLFISWKKINFPCTIRALYGGLDPFAA